MQFSVYSVYMRVYVCLCVQCGSESGVANLRPSRKKFPANLFGLGSLSFVVNWQPLVNSFQVSAGSYHGRKTLTMDLETHNALVKHSKFEKLASLSRTLAPCFVLAIALSSERRNSLPADPTDPQSLDAARNMGGRVHQGEITERTLWNY